MDAVTLFECAYLEFPAGYQPGDEYTRHVASFELDAPVGDFITLMTSPEAAVVELDAQTAFGVVLDLTIAPAVLPDYAASYVVADPNFLAGWTGTIEERVTALAQTFLDFVDATYPCSAITYSSSPATL